MIIAALNVRQSTDQLTLQQLEMFISYAPRSDSMALSTVNVLLHSERSTNARMSLSQYQRRLQLARTTMQLLKQAHRSRLELTALNDILVKSTLSRNERFNDIEQSLRLPSSLFDDNSLFETFAFETNATGKKCDVFVRCLRGQLTENDIHVTCRENGKHPLAQINYYLSEKSSHIFDIEFKRAITSVDQVTVALPCFSSPSSPWTSKDSSRSLQEAQRTLFVRCSDENHRQEDAHESLPCL